MCIDACVVRFSCDVAGCESSDRKPGRIRHAGISADDTEITISIQYRWNEQVQRLRPVHMSYLVDSQPAMDHVAFVGFQHSGAEFRAIRHNSASSFP